ncbi:MAG TPA: DUF452 family protein [Spirochaetota bacterium]|nr:DUF452 family protein [Spirochaetota bacterium]HOM37660.1 DUF452 family protein [Spirochaetota bacterium]HPQ49618.1 DUF452 family protein [Spirochaetota bacterium]
MKEIWLNKEGNDNLIIFFNGWGLDEKPFLFLDKKNFDILMFYNYQNIDNYGSINLKRDYKEIFIISFSFGVAVSSILFKKGFFDSLKNIKSIAINGTPFMISEKYGIHPVIFTKTLENLDKKNIIEFYKNMFIKEEEFKNFYEYFSVSRDFNDIKEELKKLSLISFEFKEGFINKAIISSKDKIVFSLNQKRFYKDFNIEFKLIESGHFPFYKWMSWNEIIGEVYG